MTPYDRTASLEPKLLYRRIESLLRGVPGETSPRAFARRLLPGLLQQFGDSVGLVGAHLYHRADGRWARQQKHGADAPDLGPMLDSLAPGSPTEDAAIEWPWAGATYAGAIGLFPISEDEAWVVALGFGGNPESAPTASHMLAIVSPLHFAVAHHLKQRKLEDLIEQARAIQVSLLPSSPPRFGKFDIAAASIPAHVVGGDFFDFMPLDAETLALTVADASGHGLPAALQARDVATGLRMGVERDLKITRTVEKLNRVIHRSGLVTRFISMVFGELELNGNFSYINAGHPPPLLLGDNGVQELTVGGMILGPDPAALYKLGFAHVDRGAALVLYTDGVIECGTEKGEPFGIARLSEWLTEWREGPADAAIANLMVRLGVFGDSTTFEDDVTVMMIRRPRD